MKRISYLLSMYSLAVLAVLSSCGGNEDDPKPVAKGPTVAAVTGTTSTDEDYIISDEKVFPGEIVTIKFIATKGDKDLKSFTVTEDGNKLTEYRNNVTQPYSIPSASQNTYVDSVSFRAKAGVKTYVFTATDNDGMTGSLTIKLTAYELKSLTQVTFNGDLGKVPNKGQFLATSTGANGGSANFATTANIIDVTYDTENGMNKFYSPSTKPSVGTLKGLTETKYITTNLNFATATAAEVFAATAQAVQTGATDIAVTDGGTYIFYNDANETGGIIKVSSFTPGDAGNVVIDVKALQ